MSLAEQIYEEVKHLPDDIAREVLDFIEFLGEKRGIRYKTDLIRAQQGVMDKTWDNKEDDVWNDL